MAEGCGAGASRLSLGNSAPFRAGQTRLPARAADSGQWARPSHPDVGRLGAERRHLNKAAMLTAKHGTSNSFQ